MGPAAPYPAPWPAARAYSALMGPHVVPKDERAETRVKQGCAWTPTPAHRERPRDSQDAAAAHHQPVNV